MNKIIKKYVDCFTNLKKQNINILLSTIDENFTFEDPFNRIQGKNEFHKLLKKMFKKLDEPKFEILWMHEHKLMGIIKWRFSCIVFRKKISFLGISEIHIQNNLVKKHIDYWDSGKNFYANLPLIGWVFKRFNK